MSRTTMIRTVHEVHGHPTRIEVESRTTGVRGLTVVPMVWENLKEEPGWYRLSHEGSGLAVGPYAWPSIASAKRAARRLAEILDWTEAFDDLRDHENLDDIRAICEEEAQYITDLWERKYGEVSE